LKTARDATIGRAVVALAKTKIAGKLPSRSRKRTVTPARAAVVGGVVAAIAGAVKSRRSTPATSQTPPPPPAPSGPGVPPDLAADGPDVSTAPMNYDAAGPPANTATPLPATPTDPLVEPDSGFDEEAEIAAAAADAAAIGGAMPEYASSSDDELADLSEAPLIEAGEGTAEGMEQAEADLVDEVTDPYGPGAGLTDAEVQIERAIEDQDDPFAGETEEVVPPGSEDAGPANSQ